MRIKISADSTCDLSPELIETYNIGITPLYIEKGGQNCRDGMDITPQEIFDYVRSGKGVCRTAAVNVGDYTAFFKKCRENYDAVIHFNISSDFSSCYQNACTAAAEFENVYVVDSRNLSTGIALLAERAEKGEDPKEIAALMRETAEKVEASFVIDTLFYLQKGGRCSTLAALGANLLKLKPCIEVKDGKMGVGKKYRGKIDNCTVCARAFAGQRRFETKSHFHHALGLCAGNCGECESDHQGMRRLRRGVGDLCRLHGLESLRPEHAGRFVCEKINFVRK